MVKREKRKRNNKNEGRKGLLGITLLIIVIGLANALGYIGNAIADPENTWLWSVIAGCVFALVGVEVCIKEIKRR